ncbi:MULTISPECIES: CpsB/CapC family capsule biosynthesis tyrosine phosphatase [unclassified Facklamia]|uniref:tyrosine-protein phosphatase n=1 Tax=Aerococcaceae TaxID=186827 RepID=UPI0013B9AD54|nr:MULTISPECIES: CpsB/CapC family capsule biosynthesis tyrosine phosphatase [unclassified Facklamia]MBS4462478.1 hypothetical protein [Aerococcaceae bacterium zg-B36]NEW65066.1 hypothetical protein [Facklamia sp. 252]NEW68723.1 hypothetical protein [Facklamia sp. 253]QQD65130.1 hypothetical protein JDW14_07390 [Aerococcaceae bacterium zg-252]
MLVDIHSHLLPGVDDGAQTIEQSVELAKLAVDEGIQHLLLTPHHYNNQYVNHKDEVIEATEALQDVYDKAKIPLRVYPAQEIRIRETLLEDILYRDDFLSLDSGGKYYLIEMPTKTVPKYALSVLKSLIEVGITPVIAHPERNHEFANNLRLYYQFIEAGCIGQLTSHSYIGFYGQKLRNISMEMMRHNLVHLISSDAHHIDKRPFNMQAAYAQLAEDYDERLAIYFQQNALSVFNGESIKRMRPKNKKRFWIF